jgi:hypothetical protein
LRKNVELEKLYNDVNIGKGKGKGKGKVLPRTALEGPEGK